MNMHIQPSILTFNMKVNITTFSRPLQIPCSYNLLNRTYQYAFLVIYIFNLNLNYILADEVAIISSLVLCLFKSCLHKQHLWLINKGFLWSAYWNLKLPPSQLIIKKIWVWFNKGFHLLHNENTFNCFISKIETRRIDIRN